MENRSDKSAQSNGELLQTVLRRASIVLVGIDQNGSINLLRGGVPEDLISDPSAFIGQNVFDLLSSYPDLIAKIQGCLRGEESELVFRKYEPRVFAIGLSPSLNEAGEPNGCIAVITDITERTKLEEQLRHAQKMETAGRMAGGIAHDFNNLLTVIMLNTEQLQEAVPEDDRIQDTIRLIDRAAQRGSDLTNRLLAFSRNQSVESRVIDLNPILHDLRKMQEQLLGEDIELALLMDDVSYLIQADPGQIEQVILNLSVNARDAMPQGGRIAIKLENVQLNENYTRMYLDVAPGDYVMIAMSDTGHGMKPEVLEHIFEPFFTTKAPGKGTGFGLATVYGIVKQNRGHIDVSSQEGSGTIVQIYLPRAEPQAMRTELKKVKHEVSPGRKTILLVEDAIDVRESLCEILDSEYEVVSAGRGEEGMRICVQREEPISLLITDVRLPGISGPELVRRLHAFQPELKVLFMSGYPAEVIESYGIKNSEIVLQKPFRPEILLERIASTLAER